MPLPIRFVVLLAGTMIVLASASGIARHAGAAVHPASRSSTGWDGSATVTASPAAAGQGDGIGWD
jgi:hypothetical protein